MPLTGPLPTQNSVQLGHLARLYDLVPAAQAPPLGEAASDRACLRSRREKDLVRGPLGNEKQSDAQLAFIPTSALLNTMKSLLPYRV